MNYIPEHNPDYVNNQIQNYIDNVMHPGCSKPDPEKDKWTVAKMVSWERFGSTICMNCYTNREILHTKVNGFKTDYDKQCQIIINRETTQYRDLPYKIKGTLECIGMQVFANGINILGERIIPADNGWQVWDMENLRKVGELVFKQLGTEQYNYSEYETANLKVQQIISNWNITVLAQQVTNLAQRVLELESR